MRMSDGWGGEVEGRGGGGKRKTATATMLTTIPGGTPAVHLPFKGFGNRQAERSGGALQSLVCGSQAPSESIGTVCMFCTLRQKRYSFNCALALWRGLNGAAHCGGNYINQRRVEKKKCWVLLLFQNPLQTTAIRPELGFSMQFAPLSSAFACLWNRQRQASGWFWGNRYRGTASSGKKAVFKDSLLTKGETPHLSTPKPCRQPFLYLLSNRSVEVESGTFRLPQTSGTVAVFKQWISSHESMELI